MVLPGKLEREFDREHTQYEDSQSMKYVTNIEREVDQPQKVSMNSTPRPDGTPKKPPQTSPGGYLVVNCQIKYIYTLERESAGAYVASCMSLLGCGGRGFDERSAIARMVDALRINLEREGDLGKPLQIRMEGATATKLPDTTAP